MKNFQLRKGFSLMKAIVLLPAICGIIILYIGFSLIISSPKVEQKKLLEEHCSFYKQFIHKCDSISLNTITDPQEKEKKVKEIFKSITHDIGHSIDDSKGEQVANSYKNFENKLDVEVLNIKKGYSLQRKIEDNTLNKINASVSKDTLPIFCTYNWRSDKDSTINIIKIGYAQRTDFIYKITSDGASTTDTTYLVVYTTKIIEEFGNTTGFFNKTILKYFLFFIGFLIFIGGIFYYIQYLNQEKNEKAKFLEKRSKNIEELNLVGQEIIDSILNFSDANNRKPDFINTRVIKNILNKINIPLTNLLEIEKGESVTGLCYVIGIYNEEADRIEYCAFENGNFLRGENDNELLFYNMDDNTRAAIYSFKNNEIIKEEDWQENCKNYGLASPPNPKYGDPALSMLMFPLVIIENGVEKKIGIFSVQNVKTRMIYNEYRINILKNLISYVSLAINQANKYILLEKQKDYAFLFSLNTVFELKNKLFLLKQFLEEFLSDNADLNSLKLRSTEINNSISSFISNLNDYSLSISTHGLTDKYSAGSAYDNQDLMLPVEKIILEKFESIASLYNNITLSKCGPEIINGDYIISNNYRIRILFEKLIKFALDCNINCPEIKLRIEPGDTFWKCIFDFNAPKLNHDFNNFTPDKDFKENIGKPGELLLSLAMILEEINNNNGECLYDECIWTINNSHGLTSRFVFKIRLK